MYNMSNIYYVELTLKSAKTALAIKERKMVQEQVVNIGMGQTILKSAELSPQEPALIFEGKVHSFSDLSNRIRKISTALL